MADYPVTYEIIGTVPGQIVVRYKMSTASVDLTLPWNGVGDVEEFIGRFTPRVMLEAQLVPPADHTALIGKQGTPKEPAPPVTTTAAPAAGDPIPADNAAAAPAPAAETTPPPATPAA